MRDLDVRDVIGGFLLTALGAFVVYYASTRYELGAFSRMGPGMFPTLVGAVLCLVGMFIALPAFFRRGPAYPVIDWLPLVSVIVAMSLFALAVTTIGAVPAIVLLVFVSALADGRLSRTKVALLAGALSLIAIFVFRTLLGSPLEMFKWPF
jgi:putative tricarboxylic transport membrane protein